MEFPRLSVGAKFLATVGVLVLAVGGVAGVSAFGLARMNVQTERLFNDSLLTSNRIAELRAALNDVNGSVLEQVLTIEPDHRAELDVEFDQDLLPRVRQSITTLRELAQRGLDLEERQFEQELDELEASLQQYLQLLPGLIPQSTEQRVAPVTASASPALLAGVEALFGRMTTLTDEMQMEETREAAVSEREARRIYDSTRSRLVVSAAISLLGGLTVVLLLIRNVVPRIRDYSRFATEVSSGRAAGTLQLRGKDELAELGRALNDLVAMGELIGLREELQVEYVAALQVTATEEEAHELVQRHIERSIPRCSVVVLKRNNSANRLEAATPLAPGNEVARRLAGAEPRSCLALRFARTHREGAVRPPLLSCAVCANRNLGSTCEPLLVGGEVIGSVLVSHEQTLDGHQNGLISNSVAQAAPVLANLRNLALAESRANHDSLTGLPNKRATDDTLKRMVAQANRAITPLAAAMLDLDYFKQINDRFGHGKGDEVLAAVGAAVRSCLRASDFAGRFGGEEFLILLPETTIEGALQVAEKIRNVVSSITVTGVEREITASLGIAGLMEHGGDEAGLLRAADRALYAAKAAGRNRTVIATISDLDGRSQVDVGEPVATPLDEDRLEGEPLARSRSSQV